MTDLAMDIKIPSLHDGTEICGRIFRPGKFPMLENIKAAIIAHPYAPLGGNQDDYVVRSVRDNLLGKDFFVCTFNFR